MSLNRFSLQGQVVRLGSLYHTPAGIPLLRFWLEHRSQQLEAGYKRQAYCRIEVLASGTELSTRAQALRVGSTLQVSGFLSRESLRDERLVLHSDTLDLISE